MKKKLPKRKGVRQLSKEAWRLMSKYVRLRDRNICFTCGATVPEKGRYHAGHCFHAPKTNPVSYDERNINGQCTKCNTWGNGDLANYCAKLVHKYGPFILDELRRKKNAGTKMNTDDYEAIIADLKEKIGRLEG